MSNLVVDIGNTRVKWAMFFGKEIQEEGALNKENMGLIVEKIRSFSPEKAIVSSVDEDVSIIENHLRGVQLKRFTTKSTPSVVNLYENPATLGFDRWAGILGAQAEYPFQNCMVIDAGTSITYDYLEKDGTYRGGSISPGIQMRFKGLQDYTGRLPLVEFNGEEQIPKGTNTEKAIKSGVLQGVLHEVGGFILANCNIYNELKLLFTGGDASFLIANLKNCIFAPQIIYDPHLILKGLNKAIDD